MSVEKGNVVILTLKKNVFNKDLFEYSFSSYERVNELISNVQQSHILRIEHSEENRVIAVLLNTVMDADPAKIQWRGQIFQFMLFEGKLFQKLYYSSGRYYLEESSRFVKVGN
jgi:hypothetical protein